MLREPLDFFLLRGGWREYGSGVVALLDQIRSSFWEAAHSSELRQLAHHDSLLWRKAMIAGVTRGPEALVRYSPAFFGVFFSAALPRQRAVVRRTLRQALGPRPAVEELRDVTAVFRNFASSMTDAMLIGANRGYRPTLRSVGSNNMRSSLARGRGVIVLTAHTAGWDLGGYVLRTIQPAEVVVAMAPEHDTKALELHDALRRQHGIRIVHVGPDPLSSLPLLRHLRRDRAVVAMQLDRIHPSMRARTVRLFGQPWRVPEGALSLAALSGAPIVPVFSRRLGFLSYELINTAPVDLPRKPSEAELDQAAQKLARALERFVRAHPTQWFRFSDD